MTRLKLLFQKRSFLVQHKCLHRVLGNSGTSQGRVSSPEPPVLLLYYILRKQWQQVFMQAVCPLQRNLRKERRGFKGTCPKERSSGSTTKRAMASSLQRMAAKMCSCTTRGLQAADLSPSKRARR